MARPTAMRVLFVVAALLALSSCTSDVEWNAARSDAGAASGPASASAQPQWLFAVQSDGATTFDPSTGQLSMPTNAVTAFTDRPNRDSTTTSPQSFADLWQNTGPDSFQEDPPNAVLTYWDTTGDVAVPRSVVCEIVGDVGYSAADGRLSMGLRVLDPLGATLPATMSMASLFIDDAPFGGCGSPTEESDVEYFNSINFKYEIDLEFEYVESAGAYRVWLDCPERESESIPSAGFDIQLATADQSSKASCYSNDEVMVSKQGLAQLPYCTSDGRCTFVVSVVNTQSGTTYSTTEVQAPLEANLAIDPQLEPATLPICNKSLAAAELKARNS